MAEGNGKALAPLDEIKQVLFSPAASTQLKMALPAHISVERFQRIAFTAITRTADLLHADRKSLFLACLRAAEDGLLPDGREAALVMFGNAATYMPMVAGVLKKVRNSGELASISANVVYERDKFTWHLGDVEELIHEPPPLGEDRGKPIGVYAVATLKNGEKMREILPLKEIEKIRAVSRAKNAGPWTQWWDEMARKSAIRRLSKRLPMSTDRDDDLRRVIERDDESVDLGDAAVIESPASQLQSLLTQDRPTGSPALDDGAGVSGAVLPTVETPASLEKGARR